MAIAASFTPLDPITPITNNNPAAGLESSIAYYNQQFLNPDFQGLDPSVLQNLLGTQNQIGGDYQSQLSGYGTDLSALQGQYQGIQSGADPRFQEYFNAQMGLFENQRNQSTSDLTAGLARRGLGNSSVGMNELARMNQQYDLQERSLSSGLGLQQMGRQDQAMAAQAGLIGQQAGLDSTWANFGSNQAQQQFNSQVTNLGLENTAQSQNLSTILQGLQNMTVPEQLRIMRLAAENAGSVSNNGLFGDMNSDRLPSSIANSTVICTEIHSRGDMPDDVYKADCLYGASVSRNVLAGYHAWAIPLVRAMRRHPWIYKLVKPLASHWANDMACRMKIRPRRDWAGAVISIVGEPVCGVIGRVVRFRKAWRAWTRYEPLGRSHD